jgi:hypothetical protein
VDAISAGHALLMDNASLGLQTSYPCFPFILFFMPCLECCVLIC